MARRIQLITIFGFCATILLVSAQMVFKVFPEPPLLEKRGLAQLPKFMETDINKWPSQYANYVNDNFGFRKLLVRINNFIDVKVFHTSTSDSVLLGSDGFLFMRSDWNSFVKRQIPLTDAQVLLAARRIRAFQDRLKSRNIEFVFVMAPNKSTIYPEFMPARRYFLNEKSDRERIFAALEQVGVNFLDVAPELLDEKRKRLIYYKGDHHWNKYASLIASKRIAGYFARRFGDPAPEFSVLGTKADLQEQYGGGSLDEMLGVKNIRVNEEPMVEVRGQQLPPGVAFGDSFVRWLYLEPASQRLERIDEIFAEKKFQKAITKSDVRYVVVHCWESNSGVILRSGIWDQ